MKRSVVFGLMLVLSACGKSSPSTTNPGDAGGVESPPSDAGTDEGAEFSDPGAGEESDPGADEPTDDEGGVAALDPGGPVPVSDDPSLDLTEPTVMASVKLEIKGEDGKVYKDKPRVMRWDQLTRIPIDFGSRMHEFDVLLAQEGKSKVDVELSYNVGGKPILRKYRFDTKVGAREVVQIEGGLAIAITVTPQTIKPRQAPARDRVDTSKSRDPMADAKN